MTWQEALKYRLEMETLIQKQETEIRERWTKMFPSVPRTGELPWS